MKILVIGSGGREHALCWKIAQSPLCEKLYVAPGNSGIAHALNAELLPIAIHEHAKILAAVREYAIDLVVIGPDDALAAGLADVLEENGLTVFGARREAAKLEWSKAFAKEFLQRHRIPTAASYNCGDADEVQRALSSCAYPVALKADGLALGKGVIIAADRREADAAVQELRRLGAAAETILVEEFLYGRELSLLCFCDGKTIVPMLPSEDHKQIHDHDQGPNTGGMGAVAPPAWVDGQLLHRIEQDIVEPSLKGLQADGIDFRGILYIGLMLTAEGPKVLEYNARFGDPETQVLLPMLKSDLVEIMLACSKGTLQADLVSWHDGAAACVVLASPGYPTSSTKGLPITGLDCLDEEIVPFYAGIAYDEQGQPQTNGGRVLALTARGSDLNTVLTGLYANIERVRFEGMQYRRDIGRRT